MRRSGILDDSSNRQVKGAIDEIPPDHLGRTIPDLEVAPTEVQSITNRRRSWTASEFDLAGDSAQCHGGGRMLPALHRVGTHARTTVALASQYALHAAAVAPRPSRAAAAVEPRVNRGTPPPRRSLDDQPRNHLRPHLVRQGARRFALSRSPLCHQATPQTTWHLRQSRPPRRQTHDRGATRGHQPPR